MDYSTLFICFIKNTSLLLFFFHQSLYLFSFFLLISSLLLWKTLADDRLSTYFVGLFMIIDYCIPLKLICLYQDFALGIQDIRLLTEKPLHNFKECFVNILGALSLTILWCWVHISIICFILCLVNRLISKGTDTFFLTILTSQHDI